MHIGTLFNNLVHSGLVANIQACLPHLHLFLTAMALAVNTKWSVRPNILWILLKAVCDKYNDTMYMWTVWWFHGHFMCIALSMGTSCAKLCAVRLKGMQHIAMPTDSCHPPLSVSSLLVYVYLAKGWCRFNCRYYLPYNLYSHGWFLRLLHQESKWTSNIARLKKFEWHCHIVPPESMVLSGLGVILSDGIPWGPITTPKAYHTYWSEFKMFDATNSKVLCRDKLEGVWSLSRIRPSTVQATEFFTDILLLHYRKPPHN